MPRKRKMTCSRTGRYCKLIVSDDSDCVPGTIRTITLSKKKGVKARTCRRRGAKGPRGGRTKVLSYLYPKKRSRRRK